MLTGSGSDTHFLEGEFEMKRLEQERPIQMPKTPVDLQQEIRRRAYEIYLERGTTPGSEVEDWLQAEAELLDTDRTLKAA